MKFGISANPDQDNQSVERTEVLDKTSIIARCNLEDLVIFDDNNEKVIDKMTSRRERENKTKNLTEERQNELVL